MEDTIKTFDSTINRDKIMDLLYSNYLDETNHHKKVLSKFTSDIIDYFELNEKLMRWKYENRHTCSYKKN